MSGASPDFEGVYDALPGVEVPVGAISRGLSDMWAEAASSGRPSPPSEDAKAIQVNFVLHLGLNTDPDDAVTQFDTAVRFSRRYPCRVVVLCPLKPGSGTKQMRAKVYGECTIGRSPGDARCCEFVVLSYPQDARTHLENQVSISMSTDLPLYYWAHRFTASVRLADYRYLLTTARRVLIDSAAAPEGAMSYPWPRPENLRDLAVARLLPVRQILGQFLSRYPARALAEGLSSVSLASGADLVAEGRVLLAWIGSRLADCGAKPSVLAVREGATALSTFQLSFVYEGGRKHFSWTADMAAAHASFEADFGTGRTSITSAVGMLAPENALSEAMFF